MLQLASSMSWNRGDNTMLALSGLREIGYCHQEKSRGQIIPGCFDRQNGCCLLWYCLLRAKPLKNRRTIVFSHPREFLHIFMTLGLRDIQS
jgi:hypothetical protein